VTITLGVLAKWPAAGKAKTRLIPLLGADGAAQVAMQLLQRSLHWIDQCPPDVRAVLWTDGGEDAQWQGLIQKLSQPARWQIQPQPGGHLGERMQTAMSFQLRQSACAALMGTDTPTLGPAHVAALQQSLMTHDAAFVPAFDGGYVMVGMRNLARCVAAFGPLDWGTERVAEQTRSALQVAGASQMWLAPEPDLDEPADYEAAVRSGAIAGLI
jgi:rSAM/selenodomain-associated transferase 1